MPLSQPLPHHPPAWRRSARRIAFGAILAAGGAGVAVSASGQPAVNLGDLTIEQLLNEPVISTARMPTGLFQAAAAVSVVSADDIGRLDLTTLPEALRYVPGLDVAQISASEWAVASRGSNAQFANDTLVLSDGRSLYTDANGGVFWRAQASPLIDIDRIEVVRGPGASLWGANAVNGVVNIVTKSAFDTTGTLVTASEGTDDSPSVTARYGAALGSTGAYRTELTYFDRNALVTATGADAGDSWRGFRADMRADLSPSVRDSVLIEGGYYDVIANETQEIPLLNAPYAKLISGPYASFGYNLEGRWSRTVSDQSTWSVQASVARDDDSAASLLEKSLVCDLNFQDTFAPIPGQELVWGTQFRLESLDLPASPAITWSALHQSDPLYSAFLQDKLTVVPNQLAIIAGTKLEHQDVTGFEVQPTLRGEWTPDSRDTLWAGVSRAVRTPSVFESSGSYIEPLPPSAGSPGGELIYSGNPNLQSEKLIAYEAGYRTMVSSGLSLDVETFYNRYSALIADGTPVTTFVPTPAPQLVAVATEANMANGESWGAEFALSWQIATHWRIVCDYSALRMVFRPDDSEALASPEHQVHVRSYWDLNRQLSLNAALSYVSRITYNAVPIPAYVRCDLGATWKLLPGWELGLWGRNLLDRRHLEFASTITPLTSEVPRGYDVRVIWKH